MRASALVLLLAGLVAADERVDRIFNVWDNDGDGILTRDEIPDEGIFKSVDANKDGKITRDEVAKYVGAPATPGEPGSKKKPKAAAPAKKTTDAPRKAPRTVKERVADFFRRFDANKDKRIQKKEFRAGAAVFKDWDRNQDDALSRREVTRFIAAQLRQAKRNPTVANFFELFDLNRDKKVTKREYDGPGQFFRQYDHNKNKVVTEKELTMGPGGGKVMTGDDEFMGDGPTTEPKLGLLERYDADKDGRITLAELKKAESIMKRLDKNGDGVLSGSEVR